MFDFIARLRRGDRFMVSLLTGNFGESPVDQQFAAWFLETPARSVQRDLFVKLSTGVGGPREIVAERLLGSIMQVWKGAGVQFGDVLARQLDELIVFKPPTTPEQAETQRAALKGIEELKARLRALDEPPR